MPRPQRIEYPGAWYHVMNRGAGRRVIFRTNVQRQGFLELLGELSEIYGIAVHAYCLMGNHYHLLIHTPRGNLSAAMRHLNSVYTQRFNRSIGTDGPLFRGRYKAVVVEADAYLAHSVATSISTPRQPGLTPGPISIAGRATAPTSASAGRRRGCIGMSRSRSSAPGAPGSVTVPLSSKAWMRS